MSKENFRNNSPSTTHGVAQPPAPTTHFKISPLCLSLPLTIAIYVSLQKMAQILKHASLAKIQLLLSAAFYRVGDSLSRPLSQIFRQRIEKGYGGENGAGIAVEQSSHRQPQPNETMPLLKKKTRWRRRLEQCMCENESKSDGLCSYQFVEKGKTVDCSVHKKKNRRC